MSHETHHQADNKIKVSFSSSFWFVIILAGLFIAAINFVNVMGHDEEGHGAGGHGATHETHGTHESHGGHEAGENHTGVGTTGESANHEADHTATSEADAAHHTEDAHGATENAHGAAENTHTEGH